MLIFFKNLNLFFENLNEYGYSLILISVFIYVIITLNIFLIFFLFDTSKLKSLNNFKYLYNVPFISVFLIVILLSFAGVPPFIGFLNKFLIFIYIFHKSNFILVTIFIIINLFTIYFYIQNIKFMVSKIISNIFIYYNNVVLFKDNSIIYLNLLNFFNILGLVYYEEIILNFNYIISNVYF